MTSNTLLRLLPAPMTLVLVLLLSCTHEPEILVVNNPNDTTTNPPDTTQTGSTCDPDTVYFQQAVLPMLQSGCAMSGCHDAGSQTEGVVLDSYAHIMSTGGINTSNPEKSKIYRQMVKTDDERMPPPPAAAFTSDQLATVLKWIRQGAKNNSCTETGCDTSNVTYLTYIKPMIQTYCLGCHSGSNPGGGIFLSTYDDVKAIANNGKFLGTIEHLSGYSAMPKNGNKLSDCQINAVKAWINKGLPN